MGADSLKEWTDEGRIDVTAALIKVRIQSIRYEATDVLSFNLRPLEGPLPFWTAGSHIDVHLPNGLVRSYSLSGTDGRADEYRLTVQRDPATRGGSKQMHDDLRVGQILEISTPRNNFELNEAARYSVFLAGGIGVTPFLPMAARLNALGRSWKLFYCVRTPDRAAHLEEFASLAAAGAGEVETVFDGLPGGQMLDLGATLRALPADAHAYCCGPEGMLNAYRGAAAETLPDGQIHFEYFAAHVEAAADAAYVVTLAKSGKQVEVKVGETLLNAIRDAGVDVPSSCEEGVCGACETRVLSGTPDHRDMILSDRERAESKTMMICCSGSKTPQLVLDL